VDIGGWLPRVQARINQSDHVLRVQGRPDGVSVAHELLSRTLIIVHIK